MLLELARDFTIFNSQFRMNNGRPVLYPDNRHSTWWVLFVYKCHSHKSQLSLVYILTASTLIWSILCTVHWYTVHTVCADSVYCLFWVDDSSFVWMIATTGWWAKVMMWRDGSAVYIYSNTNQPQHLSTFNP